MTFEEFEKIVEASLEGLESYCSSWSDTDGFYIRDGKLVQKHVTGGASGGSCWGDEAQSFSNDTPMQEFLPLDKILKVAKPDISYLDYRAITDMIEEGTDEDYEYYGNHTNYLVNTLDIRQLYDKLFPE